MSYFFLKPMFFLCAQKVETDISYQHCRRRKNCSWILSWSSLYNNLYNNLTKVSIGNRCIKKIWKISWKHLAYLKLYLKTLTLNWLGNLYSTIDVMQDWKEFLHRCLTYSKTDIVKCEFIFIYSQSWEQNCFFTVLSCSTKSKN